ncbi:hypothetical protein C8R43DRAFT_271004 [Mycena crocata]|nr:hypothetical protein C8R43DRAFT_271004 [Mycena crocata]
MPFAPSVPLILPSRSSPSHTHTRNKHSVALHIALCQLSEYMVVCLFSWHSFFAHTFLFLALIRFQHFSILCSVVLHFTPHPCIAFHHFLYLAFHILYLSLGQTDGRLGGLDALHTLPCPPSDFAERFLFLCTRLSKHDSEQELPLHASARYSQWSTEVPGKLKSGYLRHEYKVHEYIKREEIK